MALDQRTTFRLVLMHIMYILIIYVFTKILLLWRIFKLSFSSFYLHWHYGDVLQSNITFLFIFAVLVVWHPFDLTRRCKPLVFAFYCIKPVKRILNPFRPSDSPNILASCDPCADTQFQGEPLSWSVKYTEGGKNWRFSTVIALYLGNGAR